MTATDRVWQYLDEAPRLSMMIDRTLLNIVADRLSGCFSTWRASALFNVGVLRAALRHSIFCEGNHHD